MTTVATFLDQTGRFPRTCAFRGQADGSWQLHSSATRRLIAHIGADATHRMDYPRVHATYHADELIEPARTAGFSIEDGYELSPLQLLAKLQHFGAATGLIDFSWNPLVALWFACRQGEADNRDGKVFLVDLNDPRKFEHISNERNKQDITYIFPSTAAPDTKPLYWEPTVVGAAAHRILRQRSVFVIGRPLIPESAFDVIEILAAHKKTMRKELEERLDVSAPTLFADVQGFATVNSAKSPIRLTDDPRIYLFRGNQYTQQHKYADAIESYNRCIQLDPAVREPYFLRGNAKAASRDYSGAKSDYDLALEHSDRLDHNIGPNTTMVNDPDRSMILFNRGNARAEGSEPDYEGALKDYTDAIQYQTFDLGAAVFFNRANVKTNLGKFEEALPDYDKAIGLGYQSAQFNKGNLLVKLGRFDEAHRCFAELLRQGRPEQHVVVNEAAVRSILSRIDGRAFKAKPWSEGERSLQVRVTDDGRDEQVFPIVGNIGNSGNFGGKRLPGGEGFTGASGFVVRVFGDNR